MPLANKSMTPQHEQQRQESQPEPTPTAEEVAQISAKGSRGATIKSAAVSILIFGLITLTSYVVASHAIVVSGSSMEPTMHTGDVILVLPQSQYEVGSIVVYRVPEGQPGAGHPVIHRVVGYRGDQLILQGDNNSSIDPWYPSASDVMGKRVLLIPKLGNYLSMILEPAVLAALTAGIVTTKMLRLSSSPGNTYQHRIR